MYRSGKKRKKYGFTLVEVLITIAIIGILVSVTVYGYSIALANSRDQQRLANMNTIANALEQFYTDNKHYPLVTVNGSSTVFNASFQLDQAVNSCDATKTYLAPNYIPNIPQDPKNKLSLASCKENNQDGQYLYTAVADSTSISSPQSFELIAKMERQKNMDSGPPSSLTNNNYYWTGGFGLSSISENFYLGPKIGQ